MKRSSALTPLSHDHQHALAVALALRRADAAGVAAAVERFRDFLATEGEAHFRIEEELVLPALPPGDDEWSAAAARVREDHEAIRAAAEAPPAAVGEVRALGRRLNDHVRFEERVLFAILERRLPADELERLGRAAARAGKPRTG